MGKYKNLKGFTLVELIVVIAIIGVLASILVPNLMGYINKAKYTKANSNAKYIYDMLLSTSADMDVSGNPGFPYLANMNLPCSNMKTWIANQNLSDAQQDRLTGFGGYLAFKYNEGGYPQVVAWGDTNDSNAIIGRYPGPTNSTMYVTWNNVLSDWNKTNN